MYFWKIDKLKENLKNGLNQKATFMYILFYVLLAQFFTELSSITPLEEPASTNDYIQIIFDLAAVGIGTYLCYFANGSNSGQQFAERYFSISFVIGLRFTAIFIPVTIGFFIFGEIIGLDFEDPMLNYYAQTIISLWLITVYWRIIVHIRDVAKATSA